MGYGSYSYEAHQAITSSRAGQSAAAVFKGTVVDPKMDPKGVKLSPAQVRALMNAITTSHDKQMRTPCYKPHHAFVFYDAAGKVVGLFEMCFGCNKFVETPDGLPEYVDTAALQGLVQELGLPFGQGNDFYADACRRKL